MHYILLGSQEDIYPPDKIFKPAAENQTLMLLKCWTANQPYKVDLKEPFMNYRKWEEIVLCNKVQF